jgi:hypothetical protein
MGDRKKWKNENLLGRSSVRTTISHCSAFLVSAEYTRTPTGITACEEQQQTL